MASCCGDMRPCVWPRQPLSNCGSCESRDAEGRLLLQNMTADESAAYVEGLFEVIEQIMFEKTGGRWLGEDCYLRDLELCSPACSNHWGTGCGCTVQRGIDLSQFLCGQCANRVVRWYDHAGNELPAKVDGVPVWEIVNGRILMWRGEGRPPVRFRLSVAFGADPPVSVQRAVADMVAEQIKACLVPDECALPDNVDAVTHRGLKYQMRAPGDTNSGVWTWNQVMEIWGGEPQSEDWLLTPAG